MGWKPDEEFLRREREMIERNLKSPWAQEWGKRIEEAQRRLELLNPESKDAADLRWWIRFEQRRFGVAIRPVQ